MPKIPPYSQEFKRRGRAAAQDQRPVDSAACRRARLLAVAAVVVA